MIKDYQFFLRRYERIEDDFIELTNFIGLESDFSAPCYQVGSSRLMDFCLKVGTEVETLFREILKSSRFTSINPDKQDIELYKKEVLPKYDLESYKLHVQMIDKEILPFENWTANQKLEWFSIYSKDKHNKVALIQTWNMKNSLYALGALFILVINHPSMVPVMLPIWQ